MHFLEDLRYAVRQIRKAPGFAFAIVATLALTAGLSATVFSVIDAAFLRPLPYRDADRIFSLRTYSPQGYTQPSSYPEYLDWRRDTHAFSALAGYNTFKSVNAELPTGPVSLRAVSTTANFFEVFGVRPIMGRTFETGEDDPGRNNVVVLSNEIWRGVFAGRHDVVGSKIRLDGRICTVIGVMPAGFRFPINRTDAIYFPLNITTNTRNDRGTHWLPTVARLAAGVAPEAAELEFNRVLTRLGEAYPDTKGRRAKLVELAQFTVGGASAALRLLLYAVLALAAIGCVNLAGLLFARGVRLEREVAVRAALGAGRGRIVSQLLSVNVLYSAAGGILGVALAYGLLRATRVLLADALQRGAEVELNLTVLLLTLFIAVLTSLLAGLWPALRLAGASALLALRSGGRSGMDRRQNRLRGGFISVQVALALVLLVTAGLVFRALARLQHAELGFDPSHILAADVDLSPASYEGRDILATFYSPLLERVRAIPGVRDAGLIQIIPIQNWGWNSDVHLVGQPPNPPNEERLAEYRIVTPGYFGAFGDRLVRGRLLDDKLDTPMSQRVAVVNERFVERFIPTGLDPIGQVIDRDEKLTIVGVVRNIRQNIFDQPLAETDLPASQLPATYGAEILTNMDLVVRTAGPPEAITQDLRRVFAGIDKTLPFRTPRPMQDVIAGVLTLERLENWLFGSFAALALVLALVGLYGLISHEVELGRRDIGIRMAVGATRARILGMVYRRVGAMLAAGILAGALAALAARRLLETVVTLQPAHDALALLALAAAFIAVASLAAFVPARRAATVDPMASLRAE